MNCNPQIEKKIQKQLKRPKKKKAVLLIMIIFFLKYYGNLDGRGQKLALHGNVKENSILAHVVPKVK